MSKSKCELVRKGIMREKGEPTIEFYKNGVAQYYCYGYIDSMNDEPLEECRNCKKYVEKAQEDLEEWRSNHEP